jgi:hypothetical protein
MQILNLDILSFHLIPRTKIKTTFEGYPQKCGVSLNYSGHVRNDVLDIRLFGIIDIFNFCII